MSGVGKIFITTEPTNHGTIVYDITISPGDMQPAALASTLRTLADQLDKGWLPEQDVLEVDAP